MSPVKAADPDAQVLEDAFKDAMGTAPRPKEPPAPRETDPDAPFGRDDDGVPLEPFGKTRQGKIRLSAAGRPPKSAAPRTAPAEAGPGNKPAVPEGKKPGAADYSEGLTAFANQAWFVMTMAADVPWSRVPLIGRLKVKGEPLAARLESAQTRIHAQAQILHSAQGELVAAVNVSAQHSPRARRWAEKINTEGADLLWMLQVAMLVQPIAEATATLWTGKFNGADEEHPAEKLVAQANRDTFDEAKRRIVAQYTRAAAAQAAELAAQAQAAAAAQAEGDAR